MQITCIIATMAVSPLILNTCFMALIALGIYVVAKVVSHPPKGGASEFSLLGSQVRVKGPAWLVMLVVGGVMVGSPIIAAASQQSSVTPFEPPQPAVRVQTVPEPNYTSFTFVSDLSVLDLRNSFEQPWYTQLPGFSRWRGTHIRIRPATLTNTMVVRKIAPADLIYIKYSTSGSLDLRCLTYPYTTQLLGNGDEGQIIADVRSVGVGEEFTIITEVTYWNAFRGKHGEDLRHIRTISRARPRTSRLPSSFLMIVPSSRWISLSSPLMHTPCVRLAAAHHGHLREMRPSTGQRGHLGASGFLRPSGHGNALKQRIGQQEV